MNRTIIISVVIIAIISVVIVGVISNVSESDGLETLTGTPADNFSEKERDKFCGVGEAKSNQYVKEYKIPTLCTQPQAMTIDSQGNVWIAESNTGRLAKFNPLTESFTEFNNVSWPKGDNSMIWGLEYYEDFLWFTDDKHDSVWKFDTKTNRYEQLDFPILENSLPQRLKVDKSKLILNDVTGSQIIIIDNFQSDEMQTYSLPSNSKESILGDFVVDSKNNLWYTNWIPEKSGILAKINQTTLDQSILNQKDLLRIELFALPQDIKTPSGISLDQGENIWIVDSSSSLIFKFDSENKTFSKLTTFDPYDFAQENLKQNNFTSNPYWIENDSSGNLVFNEQGANRIGVLDPDSLSLVEYVVPSRNPHWGDCQSPDCGLAQIFGLSVHGKKIWFSEWAENKIGFVDTSIPLPFDIELDSKEVILKPGDSVQSNFSAKTKLDTPITFNPIIINPNSESGISVDLTSSTGEGLPSTKFEIKISLSNDAIPGTYFVLLGSNNEEIFHGKFIKVTVQ